MQERNRLVELYLAFREWWPTVPALWADWCEQVKENPRLILETPAVRVCAIVIAGLLAIYFIGGFVDFVTPAPLADARPRAKTADFHVICTNEECSHHFVIKRKFSFKDFPVKCSMCGLETGQQALRCRSRECRGRYVPVVRRKDGVYCTKCGRKLYER